MEIHQKISMPDYQKLKTMVKRSTEQKLRSRNFDARNERIGTGAVVKSRRGQRGVQRGKGVCYQWKAKGQCSDKCSFRDVRAKPTPKTAPPLSHQRQRGRVRRGKRASEAGVHLGSSLDSRAKTTYLKGTFTKSPCDDWHPPECQFYKSESACKFGEKCSFAQPGKKLKKRW